MNLIAVLLIIYNSYNYYYFYALLTVNLCGLIYPHLFANATQSDQNAFENGKPMPSCEELDQSEERRLKNQNSGDQTWVVIITLSFASNQLCQGALLTLKWVITAAHCLTGHSAQNLKVVAASEAAESHLVSDFVVHPDYNATFHHHNLALVKTASPFTLQKGISPICPQSKQESISCEKSCHVSFADLTPFRTTQMDLESCQTEYAKFGLAQWVTKSVKCLDDISHTTQNCIGISGTPLTCLGNKDKRILNGLLSLGWHCVNPYSPAIFTKITDYYEWISDSIQGDEFGLLQECSQTVGGNYIESVRNDNEGLHIDVFIPKKDLGRPYKSYPISSTQSSGIQLTYVNPSKPGNFILTKIPNVTTPIHAPTKLQVYSTQNVTHNTTANLETLEKINMTTHMMTSTMSPSVEAPISTSPLLQYISLSTQNALSNKDAMPNKITLPPHISPFIATTNTRYPKYYPSLRSLHYSSTTEHPLYFLLRSKAIHGEVKFILKPDPKITLNEDDSFRLHLQIKP